MIVKYPNADPSFLCVPGCEPEDALDDFLVCGCASLDDLGYDNFLENNLEPTNPSPDDLRTTYS